MQILILSKVNPAPTGPPRIPGRTNPPYAQGPGSPSLRESVPSTRVSLPPGSFANTPDTRPSARRDTDSSREVSSPPKEQPSSLQGLAVQMFPNPHSEDVWLQGNWEAPRRPARLHAGKFADCARRFLGERMGGGVTRSLPAGASHPGAP